MKEQIDMYQVVVYDDGSMKYDISGSDVILAAAFTGLTDTLSKLVKDGTFKEEFAFSIFDRYKGVLRELLDGIPVEEID